MRKIINIKYVGSVFILASLTALAGCSSAPRSPRGQGPELAENGPTVLYARSEPGMIELNRELQPIQPAEVFADVKDFKSPVAEVRLKFSTVPLEIPMQNIGGSTWRAELSPRQLEMLAVSGRTIRYDAQVVAKNQNGDIAMSRRPVEFAIRAPDLGRVAG